MTCNNQPRQDIYTQQHRWSSWLPHQAVPNVCDPEMISVEGVDYQSSKRSLSISPASVSKMIIQKGYGGGSGPPD